LKEEEEEEESVVKLEDGVPREVRIVIDMKGVKENKEIEVEGEDWRNPNVKVVYRRVKQDPV
jgi:hypothetical protein